MKRHHSVSSKSFSFPLIVRRLGLRDYLEVFREMRSLTAARHENSPDELWLVEHPPVFTQGLNGKPEHLLAPGDIPVVLVDRGGQVTYHGPGQVVVYLLLDVQRVQWGVRRLVSLIEESIIELLVGYGIDAYARPDAPGVYVDGAKIASLGLRIRKGRSYHGVSLNVAMDLEPFGRINPCGYRGLQVIQLKDLGISASVSEVGEWLLSIMIKRLGSTTLSPVNTLPSDSAQETGYA